MKQWVHKAVFIPATLNEAELAVLHCFGRDINRNETVIPVNALTHRRTSVAALACLLIRELIDFDVQRQVYVLTPNGRRLLLGIQSAEKAESVR